jgi:hypothetical protein
VAKTNELLYLSQRPVGEKFFVPSEQRGCFVSLFDQAEIAAAKDSEHPVIIVRVREVNKCSRWESRLVIAANNDPCHVLPFSNREEANKITQEINQKAEFLRHNKN